MSLGIDRSVRIADFYRGCSVFVTGGTGFLGKVLIEKILRTCTDVDKVYMLMRPKKGRSCEERLAKLFENVIFGNIRENTPSALAKVVCVAGDISLPNLGLSECDRATLIANVNVVFHSAATIRFDEPFDVAANMNVFGTKRVMDLAREMRNFKSFVHVSTAYSNVNRAEMIEERIYPIKVPISWDTILECMEKLPAEASFMLAELLQGKLPNTYTLSKGLTEQLVEHYHTKYQLPVCIIRPSMVGASYLEPIPGWVDNFNGLMVVVVEINRGTLQATQAGYDNVVDVVPVDICCNMMLACAWYTIHKPCPAMRVLNCTTGSINSVTWGYAGDLILKLSLKCPSQYQLMYPSFRYTGKNLWYTINEYFYHLFVPLLADCMMRLRGIEPKMFNIALMLKSKMSSCSYFATHEWKFEVTNVLDLVATVQRDAPDACDFNCDIKSIYWPKYAEDFVIGARRYLLREDDSTIPAALAKQQILYAVKWILHGLQLYFCYFILRTFCSLVFGQ